MTSHVLRILRFSTAVSAFFISISSIAYANSGQLNITVAPFSRVDQLIEAPVRIALSGVIDADSPRRLQSTLSRIKAPWIAVYLDSPGGDLSAGLKIGRILRERQATVTVGKLSDSYRISIDQLSRERFDTYLGNCLR